MQLDIQSLPDDVLVNLFRYADDKTIVKLQQTCQKFLTIIQGSRLDRLRADFLTLSYDDKELQIELSKSFKKYSYGCVLSKEDSVDHKYLAAVKEVIDKARYIRMLQLHEIILDEKLIDLFCHHQLKIRDVVLRNCTFNFSDLNKLRTFIEKCRPRTMEFNNWVMLNRNVICDEVFDGLPIKLSVYCDDTARSRYVCEEFTDKMFEIWDSMQWPDLRNVKTGITFLGLMKQLQVEVAKWTGWEQKSLGTVQKGDLTPVELKAELDVLGEQHYYYVFDNKVTIEKKVKTQKWSFDMYVIFYLDGELVPDFTNHPKILWSPEEEEQWLIARGLQNVMNHEN